MAPFRELAVTIGVDHHLWLVQEMLNPAGGWRRNRPQGNAPRGARQERAAQMSVTLPETLFTVKSLVAVKS
jgi:hypothetical protein